MGKIVIAYVHIQCPNDACRSTNIRTIDTRWPERKHICNRCGTRFRSYDNGPDPRSKPGDMITRMG